MRLYEGKRLVIELTIEAKASLAEAESHVPTSHSECFAQLCAALMRLANHGWIQSEDVWEQVSPAVYAVKSRCCLRAFGWFDGPNNRIFVVGHAVCSKSKAIQESDAAEAERVRNEHYRRRSP